MQLNHFADPFQNGQASVDQFFSESNSLTDQYNPGYDTGVGYGYTQNTDGYEWGNGSEERPSRRSGGGGGSGGSHSSRLPPVAATGCANGGCGSDPAALARANMDWEQQQEGARSEKMSGTGEDDGDAQPLQITDYLYHIGPDALEFDPELEAPTSGVEYWKKRVPSLLINGVGVLVWMWLWSHFGWSGQLPGTIATVVYWGFVLVMAFGVFQSDHRAARYEEEREQLTSIESNLHLIIKVIAGAVALLLGFKLLDGKAAAVKQSVYISLAIAFFGSLFSVMALGSKKRGESVRRYRKLKSAVLNLSIALIAVAAMLTFNVGTTLSGQSGGGGGQEPQRVVHVVQSTQEPSYSGKKGYGKGKKNGSKRVPPFEQVEYIHDAPDVKKIVHIKPSPIEQHEIQYAPPAPSPSITYAPDNMSRGGYPPSGQSGQSGLYAPTVLQPQHPVQQPPGGAYPEHY
jgi:hypothetical protein